MASNKASGGVDGTGKGAGRGMGNEQESPELHLSRGGDVWRRCNGIEWVCNSELVNLFELNGASRIVLVAKEAADRSTYRVKLGRRCGCGCDNLWLDKPVDRTLMPALSRWLEVQAKAGRVHVGVRIVGD